MDYLLFLLILIQLITLGWCISLEGKFTASSSSFQDDINKIKQVIKGWRDKNTL